MSSITDNGGSNVEGRFLARNGAVTLNSTNITKPTCVVAAPATLHIVKTVVNDNGGNATELNFNLHVKLSGVDVAGSPATGTLSPGTSYTLDPGTYVISEDANASYAGTFSGDCDASGNITLTSGQDKTCTITNDDIQQPRNYGHPWIAPQASQTTAGMSAVVLPIITIPAVIASIITTPTVIITPNITMPIITPLPSITPAIITIPTLPNKGFPPQNKNTPWNIVILSGISLIYFLFYFVQKNKTI